MSFDAIEWVTDGDSMNGNGKIKEEIKSYYDERAEEYDEIYRGKGHTTLDPSSYLEDVVRASEIASQFGNGHLIDIGCGTGFWLQSYYRNCSEITLIDQSEKMLRECRKRITDLGLTHSVHFVQRDFLEVELEPSTFDSAFFGFLLSHFTTEQEKIFFLKLKGILKPQGQFMIVDSAWNDERKKYRIKEGIQERRLNDGRTFTIYKRYFEKSDIDEMALEYGFRIESFHAGKAFIAVVSRWEHLEIKERNCT